MAGNHPPMASSSQRGKQAIRHQEKSGTRQIPEGRKRQETAMESHVERQAKGQLGPYGSRRGPNPTTPHRASGETKERRTMLPLRGTRTHVQGMPKEAQQTPSLHQSPDSHYPTDKHHHHHGSNDRPNRDRRGESQPL